MRFTNYRRLGDVIQYAKSRINYVGDATEANIMRYNFNLLGDPLIEFKIATKPELHVNEINITNENNSSKITENDKIAKIKLNIFNAGTKYEINSLAHLTHNYSGNTTNYEQTIGTFCRTTDVEFNVNIENQPGFHTITIELENGETVTHTFYVIKNLSPISPLTHWNIANPPHFRFLKNPTTAQASNFNLTIYEITQNDTNFIYSSVPNEVNIAELHLD